MSPVNFVGKAKLGISQSSTKYMQVIATTPIISAELKP